MAYPATRLVRVVEIAPGADLTADPATWTWVDVSAYLIVASPITIRRGRANESTTVGASRCDLRLKNLDSRFSPHHPGGAYWPNWRRGLPIRVRVNPGSGLATRFTGFVDEIGPGWPTGRTSWSEVQVVAQGLLRRLGQAEALDSALRRKSMYDDTFNVRPVAYWPMEDEASASVFGSALGGSPITFSDMRLAADSGIAGSAPLPVAGANASFRGQPPSYPAASAWSINWAMRLPAAPTVKTSLLSWITRGSIPRWTVTLTPQVGTDLLRIEAYDILGNELLADPGVSFATANLTNNISEPYGQQLWFHINGGQSGADVSLQLIMRIAEGHTIDLYTAVGATIGNVLQVDQSAAPGLTAGNYAIGHISVAASSVYGTFAEQAASGFNHETTVARFSRLCREERIAAGTDTNVSASPTQMGAQPRAALLELLRQAEAAEDGLMWEATDGKLMFRSRDRRYNRSVVLALDVAQKHVKLPFAPTEDDQRLRNDVTVSRTGGSSARYSNVDVRDGVYATSLSLNVDADADLLWHAQWHVHTGTVDEMRVPALPLNFQSSPALIATWLALDIGDWLTVANLPSQYPPGTLGAVLEGYTEVIEAVGWSASLNVSPSRPWEVWQVEHSRLGRLDTAGAKLTAGVSTGATSLPVVTTSGPMWTTAPGDFPLDFELGGWRVTATAISSGDPTLVGVGAAAAANNAAVTPALPAGIQAGDLLLCWAGCRNDASGVTIGPAGWTTLVSLNSTAKLFGKIATGSDPAPVITFSGLVAGDTTLAQCAAFRNVTATTTVTENQLNASAQDVAYPSTTATDNSLVLYLGWKPNAWTSVATIAGATEIGDPSSALGSGLGLVWDYVTKPAATVIAAGSFVVTGGVAAASRGALVVLTGAGNQTITVNAIPAAVAINTPVRLWHPGVLGL